MSALLLLFRDDTTSSSHCTMDEVTIVWQLLGWFVLAGTLLSFVPQYIKIIRHGAAGLAPFYVALSSFAALFLVFGYAFDDFGKYQCCRDTWSVNMCADKLVPVFQGMAIFISNLAVFSLFLAKQTEDKKLSRILFAVLSFAATVLMVAAGVSAKVAPGSLEAFADVMVGMNVVVGIVLYAPQYRLVWINESAGSLSLLTLFIQTFGQIPAIVMTMKLDIYRYQIYGPQFVSLALSLGLWGLCMWYDHVRPYLDKRRGIERPPNNLLTKDGGVIQYSGLQDAFGNMEMEEATKLGDDFLEDEDF